jgi:outer membrane protein TolC
MSIQGTTVGRNYLCHIKPIKVRLDTLADRAAGHFEVALTAYQSGKVSFVALAAALRRGYDARVSYLQCANQFVANRVALEQAVGAPLDE